jgi:hypothetical protein
MQNFNFGKVLNFGEVEALHHPLAQALAKRCLRQFFFLFFTHKLGLVGDTSNGLRD